MMASEETGIEVKPQLIAKEKTRKLGWLGTIRLFSDLDKTELIYLLLTFLSFIGALVLTSITLGKSTLGDGMDFIFCLLLLCNFPFIVWYTINGVFGEKPFEVLVSVIATLIVLLYCVVDYAVNGVKQTSFKKNVKLGRMIAVCIFGVADMALGVFIAWKYFRTKRLIFRTVGGNVQLQKMCQLLFSFTAFLKFDFQLVITLLVLVLNGGGDEVLTVRQKLVLGIGVPLSFVWVILGFLMIRYELKQLSGGFWLLGLLFPTYVIYLFTRLRNPSDNPFLFPTTVSAGSVALFVRIILFGLSFIVTRNFSKGLKEKLYGPSEQ